MSMRLRNLIYNSFDDLKDKVEHILSQESDFTNFRAHFADDHGIHKAHILQPFTSVGSATFTGSGLDDATSGGTYSGSEDALFTIVIDAEGAPDTFKWRKDSGSWTTGVAITGGAQTLAEGVTITFGATTGHTLSDQWTIWCMTS